jgi:hypothetical protein
VPTSTPRTLKRIMLASVARTSAPSVAGETSGEAQSAGAVESLPNGVWGSLRGMRVIGAHNGSPDAP